MSGSVLFMSCLHWRFVGDKIGPTCPPNKFFCQPACQLTLEISRQLANMAHRRATTVNGDFVDPMCSGQKSLSVTLWGDLSVEFYSGQISQCGQHISNKCVQVIMLVQCFTLNIAGRCSVCAMFHTECCRPVQCLCNVSHWILQAGACLCNVWHWMLQAGAMFVQCFTVNVAGRCMFMQCFTVNVAGRCMFVQCFTLNIAGRCMFMQCFTVNVAGRCMFMQCFTLNVAGRCNVSLMFDTECCSPVQCFCNVWHWMLQAGAMFL